MFPNLEDALAEDARRTLAEALSNPRESLQRLLPGLARRMGRAPLHGGRLSIDAGCVAEAIVDADALRLCDAAGATLIRAAGLSDDAFVDLFLNGDMEERTIVLRAMQVMKVSGATIRLLEEAQRTNTETHFQAAVCDSNILARALASGALSQDAFNRLVLKAAFLGLPLQRLIDAASGANAELSRMLQDLATEREAAGRAVWPDTCRMIARAPCPGTVARVVGGVEHGDDRLRFAAAEALAILARPELAVFAEERLAREPRPEIRAALERAVS